MKKLSAAEIKDFMYGLTLYAFDPNTNIRAAAITYEQDGTCVALFEDGTKDKGLYGFEGDSYWTQYEQFRGGEVNHFYLVNLAPNVVQAYHTDDRRAFVQSPLETLPNSNA